MKNIGLFAVLACVGMGVWACSSDSSEESVTPATDAGTTADSASTADSGVIVDDSGTGTSDSATIVDSGADSAIAPIVVSGTVTGLKGFGLVLQNNAGADLAVAADGAFAFPSQTSPGYAVTVKTSPYAPIQSCVVANGSGSSVANVSNVTVTCTATGLLLEYRFDEGTGTNVIDSSGGGSNGTHNATYFATGKHGKAISFDGSQMLTVASAPSWGAADAEYTLEYWLYIVAVNPSAATILHKMGTVDNDDARNPAHFLYFNSTKIYPVMGTTSNANFYGPSETNAWALGAWTHVAVVHSGTNQLIYRDGTLLRTDALPSATVGGAGKLYVGKDPYYGGLNGYMDEFRVYGRALSQAEIQRDMQ